jgi:hypothetical protein
MNSFDSITLRAFLQALAQQDRPLPSDVQQTLHQMADRLSLQQTATLDTLRDLVEQYPTLEQPYSKAYRAWQQRYQAQERTKSLSIPANGFSDFDLERFVLQVFNAEDSTVTAKQVIRRLNAQPAKRSNFWERGGRVMAMASGGAALGAMVGQVPGALIGAVLAGIYGWYSGAKSRPQVQQAINAQDAEELAILKAIEKNPLTIRDLLYARGLSSEMTNVLVQSLWQQGYLDRITTSLFHILFPTLRGQRAKTALAQDDPLTLTAKGYFRLHPLLQPSRRGRQK